MLFLAPSVNYSMPQVCLAEVKNNIHSELVMTHNWVICFREFTLSDGKVTFPVNFTLQGDVTITVYHGRSTLGGKVQGRMTSIRIFQLQFHTGFINPNANKLKYSRLVIYF